MTRRNIFKPKEGRQKRIVHPDGNFRRGMRYTDSFIRDQAVKLLVNHRIMDNGTYITPRLGIAGKDTDLGIFTSPKIPAPHVAYYGTYFDEVEQLDKYGNIVLSFGVPSSSEYKSYLTDKEVSSSYYTQVLTGTNFGVVMIDDETLVADTALHDARVQFYKKEPKPIHTIFNYSLYYLGKVNGTNKLLKVKVVKTPSGFEIRSEPVVGKDVTLSESTSVGFNMLNPKPYDFENELGLTLSPMGIMPYSTTNSNNLMLSANAGEHVKFIVYYLYGAGQKFKVKWEQALANTTEYVTLQDYGTVYNAGDEISLEVQVPSRDFILRCTMTPFADNALQEHLSKVAVYPIFTVGESDIRDINQNDYDLHSATGISEHNEMMVLWGVPGAETALFFSDVLDATYFPFPQYTFNFSDPIIHVKSFASSLLVFTERTIYLIEGYSMWEMTYPRSIFSNLEFEKEDMAAIIAIKDGLYVKSKGKYYMLVPNVYTGQVSDMRLIPITDSIEGLIFDWKSFLQLLSDRLYKFEVSWGEDTQIRQYDFVNYADGSKIKNIYRFAVHEDKDTTLYRYQIDVILLYDIEMNTWTVEVASFPYNGLVPQGSSIYTSYVANNRLYLQGLNYKNQNCKDTYNTMYYGQAKNDSATSARENMLNELPETGQDTVVRVIDGDTIVLENLGRVRFLFVDTPESTDTQEPYGIEATAYVRNILSPGATVTYEFDTGGRVDLYDRALVWIHVGDFLVQEELARRGFVKAIYNWGATSSNINLVQAAIDEAIDQKLGLYRNIQPDGPYIIRNRVTSNLLGNFQILDTGNRDHNSYIEKRYKEIQYMFHNSTSNILRFYTEFYIDSQKRQTSTSYEISHILNENEADYGTIYVREVETSNMEISNETELGFWELDVSQFPVTEILKVIFRISGRGLYPRMILVSRNEEPYKLLNYSWVYRTMNAR